MDFLFQVESRSKIENAHNQNHQEWQGHGELDDLRARCLVDKIAEYALLRRINIPSALRLRQAD